MVNHQKGFSLLELLLVLVCMAAIISWSLHNYKVRQRRAQTLQVQSDIKSLQRALDNYFHITGCDDTGVFAGSSANSIEVSCETLQQYGNNIACSRAPLAVQYSAKIIKTDQVTTGTPPKPVYQLEVLAEMPSNFTGDQITWFQQELQAKTNVEGQTLVWDSLPTNSYVQLGDGSWILNGAGAFFRATENNRGSGGATSPQFSGSFCAN